MDDEKRIFRKFFEAKADEYLKPRNKELPYYFLSDLIDCAYRIARDISSFGYIENEFSDRLRKLGFIRENETSANFLSREDDARHCLDDFEQKIEEVPSGLMEELQTEMEDKEDMGPEYNEMPERDFLIDPINQKFDSDEHVISIRPDYNIHVKLKDSEDVGYRIN